MTDLHKLIDDYAEGRIRGETLYREGQDFTK